MRQSVRVITRAKMNRVVADGDALRVYTTTVPADGAANASVIKLLAEHLDVPKTSIKIIRGTTSRDKVIEY